MSGSSTFFKISDSSEKTIEAKSVIPGLILNNFFSTDVYISVSLLTLGLGPQGSFLQ